MRDHSEIPITREVLNSLIADGDVKDGMYTPRADGLVNLRVDGVLRKKLDEVVVRTGLGYSEVLARLGEIRRAGGA